MTRTLRPLIVMTLAVACGALAPLALRAADNLRAGEEQAMKAAIARVAPSVVRIETVGGLDRIGQMLVGTGPTTGLIVAEEGYIVSSAFNFVQKPDSILVTLADGSRRAAKVVATDQSRLLVLLKIDAEAETKLPVPEPAPKNEIRVGQWSLALGRAFEPDRPNVSVGIVSALDRIWGKALQTDAKISPNNYGGPLVDIRGRVLGVLVPMSPDGGGELAGVEWYDSGIGFAVPLEDILRVLGKLKEGRDLRPGVLGISLQGSDVYSLPAVIAAARAKGPAYQAGFRAGDKIVEAAGLPISRPAELKHALGPHYAGDRVQIVAERGDARVEREVELVEKVEPYEFPFLGILPRRLGKAAADAGLVVRYVYPESPAAAAGLQAGDRLRSFGGQEIKSAADLAKQLLERAPEDSVKMEAVRGEQTLLLDVKLARLPETLPGDLPLPREDAPRDAAAPAAGERPAVGTVPIKVPEFANETVAYVPESYRPDVAYGVVLWLHAPGDYKPDELIERWKSLCDQRDLILLAPKATDAAAWRPTDVRFVRRMLDEVLKNYSIDPTRVVVHGHEGGAALAYLFGMANVDVVRAIAAVDSPLPRLVQPSETDPVNRLAIYTTLPAKSPMAPAIEAGIERLRALKYPLTVKEIDEPGRYLTPDELAELVRWFDTLDRL
ncbi:MAG: PDZ domain-containing protein [Pirellulales bacterium]